MEVLTKKYQKVNVDLEVKKMARERFPWQDSYKMGRISWQIYRDDGVICIRPEVKKEFRETKEEGWFNSYQYFLYRRAMFGLEVFHPDELEHMHWEKKKRITQVNRRANGVIERFMQQVMIHVTDRLFLILFPEARVTNELLIYHGQPVTKHDLITENESEPDYICDLNPYVFKITRKTIAGLLVINHVLPDNFFSLEVKDDPRIKRLQQPITEAIDTL